MTIRVAVQLAFLAVAPACSQIPMQEQAPGERLHLLPADAAVLEGDEQRTELPCTVKPVTPKLGFDFKFHSGYRALVPLRHLSGTNNLTVIFRVTPESRPEEPFYFHQKLTISPIQQDAKGEAEIRGGFVLGPGKYQIGWLMRDRNERFCSTRWQISAETRGKDRDIEVSLASGTALPETSGLFENELPMKRGNDHQLKVLVLLHVVPSTTGSADMGAEETAILVSIIRSIAREPRIGAYSVVAFNLERNEILYRGGSAPQVDFQALGEAMKRLHPGIIDVRSLGDRDSGGQLLGEVIADEMTKNHPDALIFVGPRATEDRALGRSLSPRIAAPRCPVFYLNYNATPASVPPPHPVAFSSLDFSPILRRDPIGSIVKLWKGLDYTIRKPRDLFMAWTEVMGRVSNNRTTSALVPKN